MIRKFLVAFGLLASVGALAQSQLLPLDPNRRQDRPSLPGRLAEPGRDYHADQVVVRYRNEGAFAARMLVQNVIGATELKVHDQRQAVLLQLPRGMTVSQAINYYRSQASVRYAQPNYIYHYAYTPNDPLLPQQWYLPIIEASAAWDIERGDPGVVVAVIDSGVLVNHPDLVNKWVPGYDAVDDDDDPTDALGIGHGTFVAGLVAPDTDNGVGIAGIGFNVSMMPIRAGGFFLDDFDIARAIDWAVGNGANVLNMSFGGFFPSPIQREALEAAAAADVVLIAAAGNSNIDIPFYPAGYDFVLSVGATDDKDQKAWFSNFGSWVDVAAPGDMVLSTDFAGGYSQDSGTSFASPIVAGLAALILSRSQGNLTAVEVKNLIRDTCDFVGTWLDRGRINARRALENARRVDFDDVAPDSVTMTFGRGISGGADAAAEVDGLYVRVLSRGDGRVGQVTGTEYIYTIPWWLGDVVALEIAIDSYARLGVTQMVYVWDYPTNRYVHLRNMALRSAQDDEPATLTLRNIDRYMGPGGQVKVMVRTVAGFRRRGFEPPAPYTLWVDKAVLRVGYVLD